MWAKAPYLYVIHYNIQKFSHSKIVILYIIEIIIGFLFGPINKHLKNRYGPKFFCIFYNVIFVINLLLFMQSSHFMIYLSQIIKGFGADIISNTFEEWVILESVKVFDGYPKLIEIFRRRLLISSNKYDAIVSIITSIICSFIYSYVGIYGPLYISIILSILSIVVIQVLLDENQIKITEKNSSLVPLREALFELKVDVLCIWLIEGIFNASLNVFLFSWFPILKQSTTGDINTGFIFFCMISAMITGTKLFLLLIGYLNFDYYMSITGYLFLQGLFLVLTYFIDSLLARMIFLILCNGFIGLCTPVSSIIKSDIFNKKYKGTLETLLRIPCNCYTIIILIILRYTNPFIVITITGIMCFLASCSGLFLCIYRTFIHKQKLD